MVDGQEPADERTLLQLCVDGVLARPRTLWALAAVAMALDVAVTGVGLSLGLRERNPLANATIDAVGLFGAGLLLKGGALAVAYACWRLLPRFVPGAAPQHNLLPLGVALPSWVAVGINTVLVLSVV